MSSSSSTSAKQLQVLYEIALSIGRGETLPEVAQTALSSYLRRLNCSAGGIFERRNEDGHPTYRLVQGIPTQPAYSEAFEAATQNLDHDDEEAAASFREQLPLSTEYGTAQYYIFDLPGFGVLVIIKSGAPLAPGMIAALEPLNAKLADACCNQLVEQRARRDRETLRAVLDTIPQEVFVKSSDGRYTLANEAAAAAHGVQVEQLEGATDAKYTRMDTDSLIQEADREVIESGEPQQINDKELHDADGCRRTFSANVVPIELSGKKRQALAVVTDTTARTDRQAELERREAAIEASMDGISIVNSDGKYTYVNEAHAGIFEYEPEELVGEPWRQLYSDAEVERKKDEVISAIKRDGEWRGEAVGKACDGADVHQEITLSVFEDGGAVYTNRDITAQKQREQALKRQQSRLRVLFDQSPDNIIIHNDKGSILDVNKRQVSALGYDRETLLDMNVRELEVGVEDDELASLWGELSVGETLETRGRHRRSDGSEYPVEVWVSKTEIEGEARFIALDRDITEQAQREADLRETRKQLQQSNEELEQFAYAASHDLKEPLRSVSNYLTLLDDLYDEGQTFDAQAETLIQDAVDAMDRMQSMINALLQYSRVDSRGGDLESTTLEEVITKVELNLAVRINEAGATVTTESLPAIHGNNRLLIQLFQNLIDNGLKYNDSADPRIRIARGESIANVDPPKQVNLGDMDSYQHIQIEDNGIGIDGDAADRAFDVFERLGRTDKDGTGMGLTLCQRIVEYHDGAIWIESASGDGTVVHLCLPGV